MTSQGRNTLAKPEAKPIEVLIVDDHEVVRVGLRTLFKLIPEIRIVGEASNKSSAVQEAIRLKPHVVLLDIRLPEGSGIEACRDILAACPETRVLFLTSYAEETTVLDAILAGAQGYILKDIGAAPLIQAIKTVAAGHSLLDSNVAQQTMSLLRNMAVSEAQRPVEALSKQEQRVLGLVAEGKTNKEIASALGLSDKTVKNYLSNIFDKLQVTRRSQAAALYTRHADSN